MLECNSDRVVIVRGTSDPPYFTGVCAMNNVRFEIVNGQFSCSSSLDSVNRSLLARAARIKFVIAGDVRGTVDLRKSCGTLYFQNWKYRKIARAI
jgi:hypothetical protein